jgi:hypothetical protein
MEEPRLLDADEVTTLVRSFFQGEASEFKPCAFYHKELDTIEVHTADCSYTAMWFHGLTTLYQRNRTEGEPEYVGFEIECVRPLCSLLGINGRVDLHTILDAVTFHDLGQSQVIEIARKLLSELADQTVEITV